MILYILYATVYNLTLILTFSIQEVLFARAYLFLQNFDLCLLGVTRIL